MLNVKKTKHNVIVWRKNVQCPMFFVSLQTENNYRLKTEEL